MLKTYKTTAMFASAAFANAAAPATTGATGATATAAKKAGAPKAEDRVAPEFTPVRTDILPPVSAKRGVKSPLAAELEKLPAGGSIGVKNKTKKQVASTVSKLNNADSNKTQKLGADGQPVMVPGAPIKDASGAVVGHGQPVAEMERVKHFEAYDVDPKTDKDGASVRIFRIS